MQREGYYDHTTWGLLVEDGRGGSKNLLSGLHRAPAPCQHEGKRIRIQERRASGRTRLDVDGGKRLPLEARERCLRHGETGGLLTEWMATGGQRGRNSKHYEGGGR